MSNSVSDDAFARYVTQAALATADELDTAKQLQTQAKDKGKEISLADGLVLQGAITPAQKENVEKKLLSQQQTGIKKLGTYKLVRKLGEGGMGAVFLADDTATSRRVALKILPKKHASNSEFVSRFRREAKATLKLNHVNIVSALGVGEERGNHYYAMEYFDGEPLDALLKREKMLPWEKAIEITMQVARGLKHAHDHGFIHRDIKPANIFVTADGITKILDLGLSKNIGEMDKSFNTQTGIAMGTPHYISPEQARGDKGIDGRADIYSLGATLYHLVSGETPFQGSTGAVVMMKHLTEQLPNPQDLNEDIPDSVVQVIQKMMAKDPADRYLECKDLIADLELVIDGKMPISQVLDAGKTTVAIRSSGRKGGKAAKPRPALERPAWMDDPTMGGKPAQSSSGNLYLILGVLGIGVAIAGVWLMTRGKPQPEKRSNPSAPLASVPVSTKYDSLPRDLALDLGGGVKMEFVLVKAGEFMMGEDNSNDNEKPVHPVRISVPFYIGKYDVTVAQFRRYAEISKQTTECEKGGNKGWAVKDNKFQVNVTNVNWTIPGFDQEPDHPVVLVSWNDSEAFTTWMSKTTGRDVRLPTEAQWEYAARGPDNRKYPWGDKWDGTKANHADASLKNAGFIPIDQFENDNDGYGFTSPVGKYTNASWCGAFDMAGNVLQWVWDRYDDRYYANSQDTDPLGPETGNHRVLRGGCWYHNFSSLRAARRIHYIPTDRATSFGFRVIVAVPTN